MTVESRKIFFLKLIFSISLICSLIMHLFLSDALSDEDDAGILVIGTGIISKGNVVEARNNAISEAMIKAVEEYMAKDLGSQNMANNFSRIVHEILPESKDAVENFNILAEEKTDKYYKILVRVKVNQQIIGERLKDIKFVNTGSPPVKVLFLVSQESAKDEKTSYWWGEEESGSELTAVELALYSAFQDYGFETVNRLLIVPEKSYTPEMRELRLSDEDAVRWGRIFSSNAVISGTCEIVEGDKVFVNLKGLNVENGDTICNDRQTEYIETLGENRGQVIESMKKAISRISMRMGPEIINALDKKATGVQRLEIKLNGIKSFGQFMAFSDFLKQDVPGVHTVMQTRSKGNSMTIQIEFEGDKAQFFKKISEGVTFPFSAGVQKSDAGEIIVNIAD